MGDFDPPRGLLPRLLWRVRRRRAVDRYLRQLPRRLIEDYGHGAPYRPRQVASTIGRHREFSSRFVPYAQVLFCDRAEVESDWAAGGAAADYLAASCWLSLAYFHGADFSPADVARFSAAPPTWTLGRLPSADWPNMGS
jgi:hypothetical protein